jgi:hypothetical protein
VFRCSAWNTLVAKSGNQIYAQQTSATGDYEVMSPSSQTVTVGWPDQTARSWDDSVGDRF